MVCYFLIQVSMKMFHSTGHAQHTKCKTTFDSVSLGDPKHGSVVDTSQLLIIETGTAPPNYRMPLSLSALLRYKTLPTSPYYTVSTVLSHCIKNSFVIQRQRPSLHCLIVSAVIDFLQYTPVSLLSVTAHMFHTLSICLCPRWTVSPSTCSSCSSTQNTAVKRFAQ